MKLNILPTSLRSLKLFKISDNGIPRKNQIPLKFYTNIAYVPFVKSLQDLETEVKLIFGYENYHKAFSSYVYPRQYIFKNIYTTDKKIIKLESFSEKNYEIKQHFPDLSNINYIIKNNRNTIFDFSKLISLSYPTKIMLVKDKARTRAEFLGTELLSYVTLTRNDFQPSFSQTKLSLPEPGTKFENIIISIPVETKNTRLMITYLKQDVPITTTLKKIPDDIFILSIARFLLRDYFNDPFEDDENMRLFSDAIKLKQNVIFIFHNKNWAFVYDKKDLQDRQIKTENLYRMLKTAFTNLIGLGTGILSEDDALKNENTEDVDVNVIDQKENDKLIIEKIKTSNPDDTIDDEDIFKEVKETKLEKEIKTSQSDIDKLLAQNIIVGMKANNKRMIKSGLKSVKESISEYEVDESEDDKYDEDKALYNQSLSDIENENNEAENELDESDEQKLFTGEEQEVENNEEITPTEDLEFLGNTEEDLSLPDEETVNDLSSELNENTIMQLKKMIAPSKTKAQLRRIELIKDKYKSIKLDPDDDRTLEDILNDVESKTMALTKAPVKIKDDSLTYCSLKDFENSYVKKTMTKDMVDIVKSFSVNKSINMHITNAKKIDTSDQFNSKETFVFELEDEDGQKHKIKFNMPKVDKNGFMKINGNIKVFKKQLIMLPIVKTKPDEVMVTTNFNKCFIKRQGSILNNNVIILRKILSLALSEGKKMFRNIGILSGNNSKLNTDYVTTVEYDEVAKFFHIISLGKGKEKIKFFFNQNEIRKEIKENLPFIKLDETHLPLAIDYRENKVITIDLKNPNISVCEVLLDYMKEADITDNFDELIKSLTIPKRKIFSKMTLQSKSFPLIVFLSALFGYSKVLDTGKIETHFIPKGNKDPITFDPRKMAFIKFQDGTLYYPQYPMENALLLNGLTDLDTSVINYKELDEILPYLDYLYSKFNSRNIYKGWTAMQELFIDPITKSILIDLKLPTDFLELFLYANEMLSDNNYSKDSDMGIWRFRGYETLNVLLYDAIAQEYAKYKQVGKSRKSFSIQEDAIFKGLNTSSILENYDAINPLNEIKSKSIVTYKGPHGINLQEAFSLDKRGQTQSMTGNIAMSTVEGGNVGVIKQLTINPKIYSTRGYTESTDKNNVGKLKYANLMSAEEAAIPYINRDDPKRISFTSVQTKHVIPISESTPPLIGTGFEQTLIYDIGDGFGFKAKNDGICTAVFKDEGFAVITYKDGSTDKVEFGRLLNRNSNFYIGNNIELNIAEGDKFKKNDILSYNKDFFKKHMNKIMLSQGILTRVAITEGETTDDDSCGITEEMAKRMSTTVVKKKQIVLSIHSNILKYLNIGDKVVFGDPLMLYEDQKDKDSDADLLSLLGDIDEDTLDKIMRHKAKANATGEIMDLKVYWTTSPEVMSESCKSFIVSYMKRVNSLVRKEEKLTKEMSEKRYEAEISKPYRGRINGAEIPEEGGILIEYYIGDDHSMIPGDKLSFNSSLKSVVAQVIPEDKKPYRFNGDGKVDAIFSLLSVYSRMVMSVWYNGFLGKILLDKGTAIKKKFFESIGKKDIT